MAVNKLDFTVRQEVLIHAPAETVFGFFSDNEKFSAWFGPGSSIDARKGGEVRVKFPDGSDALGSVLEISSPSRIVFSWGYPRENSPVPPGGSIVEIKLAEKPAGTLVTLTHKLPTESSAKEH